MLVLLGDNDYTQSPARFRTNWRATFSWARRSGLRVAGVLGNHDYHVNRGRYELALLGMPRPYYTRRLGDIQLFLLDSNEVNSEQTAWLESQLADSTAIWKIAVFHHPPYTCGGHSGAADVQQRWVPLFEQYSVQLVLSGHDHNYQRFVPRNGVTYVVHGGGAAGALSADGAALRRIRCGRAGLSSTAFSTSRQPRSASTATRSTCGAGLPTGSASNRRASARSGNACRPLARDHAAPSPTLAPCQGCKPGRGRVRPLAWCSRPRGSAASLDRALRLQRWPRSARCVSRAGSPRCSRAA